MIPATTIQHEGFTLLPKSDQTEVLGRITLHLAQTLYPVLLRQLGFDTEADNLEKVDNLHLALFHLGSAAYHCKDADPCLTQSINLLATSKLSDLMEAVNHLIPRYPHLDLKPIIDRAFRYEC